VFDLGGWVAADIRFPSPIHILTELLSYIKRFLVRRPQTDTSLSDLRF